MSTSVHKGFTDGIKAWVKLNGKKTARLEVDGTVAVPLFTVLPARVIAGIATKIVINGLFENLRWSVTARRIGRALWYEIEALCLSREAGYRVAKMVEGGSYSRKRAMELVGTTAEVDQRACAVAGMVCLEIFEITTGFVTKSRKFKRGVWDCRLTPTQEANTWLSRFMMRTGSGPMFEIEESPHDWHNDGSGGSTSVDRRGLVRSKQVPGQTPPAVVAAANAAQAVRYTANRQIASEMLKSQETLHPRKRDFRTTFLAGQAMSAPESFGFYHSYDFRGRIYPLSVGLNPQGDDRSRGLLALHGGEPLTTSGLAAVLRYCESLPQTSWELRAITEGLNGRERTTSWGHPVRVDGRANGLQIIALLTRDQGLCAATGVDGSGQDLYTTVASRTWAKVISELECASLRVRKSHHCLMRLLPGGIPRDLAKQLLMVIPYGATDFGLKSILEDHLRPIARKKSIQVDHLANPMRLLILCFRESLAEIAPSLKNFVDRVLAWDRLNHPTWTTPDGFIVNHQYLKSRVRQARTRMNGRIITSVYGEELREMDKKSAAAALLPNIVHSFDGAVCRGVLRRMPGRVVTVHDSFACHPNHVEIMMDAIRESVIEVFSVDHLNTILGRLRLPRMELGKFDISNVSSRMYS